MVAGMAGGAGLLMFILFYCISQSLCLEKDHYFRQARNRAGWLAALGTILLLAIWKKNILSFPAAAPLIWVTGAIFLLLTFRFVHHLVDVLFPLLVSREKSAESGSLEVWLLAKGSIKGLLWVLTALVALRAFYLYNITSLLGTSALAAMVAKDLLANVFGALVVLVAKPFRVGDWIVVKSVSGRVENIGLRATTLSAADGSIANLPNLIFLTEHLVNFGQAIYQPLSLRLFTGQAPPDKFGEFLTAARQCLHAGQPDLLPASHLQLKELGHPTTILLHLFWHPGKHDSSPELAGYHILTELLVMAKNQGFQVA